VCDGTRVKRGYGVIPAEACCEAPGRLPAETVRVFDKDGYAAGCIGYVGVLLHGNLVPFHA